MTQALEPGDVTAAVIWILQHDTALLAEYPQVTVSDTRVGQERDTHWITVTRRGGVPGGGFTAARFRDRARIDIDTYAPTISECFDMAAKAKVAVQNAAETFIGYRLAITAVEVEQGLNELPDPQHGDARVFQTLAVHTASVEDHQGPPNGA